ncbi:MAG: hypothetical protein E3J21_27300 [Anaerolineales bacterium]|nr:MAG: hypothetical protein E3J21_27300 [Anaerolineales bacterium]
MDVRSEKLLQEIKFDYLPEESPTEHGWALTKGSEEDLLSHEDPVYGYILRIKAKDLCLDYDLVGKLKQECKAVEFVVRSESKFSFHAVVRFRSQQQEEPPPDRVRLRYDFNSDIEVSYPEPHQDYLKENEVEYGMPVTVEQLKDGWILTKIDLPHAVAAIEDKEWEFNELLTLRIKGSGVEIDCARIELYKENPWERPFGLQDASDYPDRGLRQPPAIPTSPAIRQLANLIRARRQTGDRPYTLLLGSSLSLTPEIRRAVCSSDDWEAFWTAMERLSAAERRALLADPLDGLNLTAGYRCLAQLVQASYFGLVFTLNVDDALDESLRILSAREYQIFTHGQVPGTEIAAALGRTHPRVKVVKLHGDLNAYKLPLTPEGQFEFPKELEEAVERLLSQDTILVGDIPHDTDIQRCIHKSEGALWVVVPEEPQPGTFIYNAKRARPKGEIISGPKAEFVSFFSALAHELGMEGPRTSIPSPEGRKLIKFTFTPPDPNDNLDWFSAFRRITEKGRANGDWIDNNGAKNKFIHLEDFVEPFCEGQVDGALFALYSYSKDPDGNFDEHVEVKVKVKPERELSFEVTDRTQAHKREELAKRILQGIGRLKGVQLISIETLVETPFAPAPELLDRAQEQQERAEEEPSALERTTMTEQADYKSDVFISYSHADRAWV